jgi:hypothetical protein
MLSDFLNDVIGDYAATLLNVVYDLYPLCIEEKPSLKSLMFVVGVCFGGSGFSFIGV